MKRKRDEAAADDEEDALRLANLSRACEEWESKYMSLSESYEHLREDYDALMLEHTEWETTITTLRTDVSSWEHRHNELEGKWTHF